MTEFFQDSISLALGGVAAIAFSYYLIRYSDPLSLTNGYPIRRGQVSTSFYRVLRFLGQTEADLGDVKKENIGQGVLFLLFGLALLSYDVYNIAQHLLRLHARH